MKTTCLISTLLLVCCAGCVPSLHPLYTDEDIVFEKALVGDWQPAGSKEQWSFRKHEGKSYRLVYTDENEQTGPFIVHLVKLGDKKFIDLTPDDPGLKQNDFYKFHLLAAHTFMRVIQIEPELKLSVMNAAATRDLLEENPKLIRHERIDKDRLLLTAPPAELQKFILKHLETDEFFADPNAMKRRKEPAKDTL